MGNLSGESREQNRKDKVTRFRSVTYARQLGLLVKTLGSHLKCRLCNTNCGCCIKPSLREKQLVNLRDLCRSRIVTVFTKLNEIFY